MVGFGVGSPEMPFPSLSEVKTPSFFLFSMFHNLFFLNAYVCVFFLGFYACRSLCCKLFRFSLNIFGDVLKSL